jgi:hypothetical protein
MSTTNSGSTMSTPMAQTVAFNATNLTPEPISVNAEIAKASIIADKVNAKDNMTQANNIAYDTSAGISEVSGILKNSLSVQIEQLKVLKDISSMLSKNKTLDKPSTSEESKPETPQSSFTGVTKERGSEPFPESGIDIKRRTYSI